MTTHISTWLRAFRPPLERAYPCADETDLDFAELLERADERMTKTSRDKAGEEDRAKQ